MGSLLWPFINLAILLGVLYKLLKEPVKKYVRERHERIATDLTTSRSMLKESREKFEDFSARLKSLSNEIEAMRTQMARESANVKDKVLKQAEAASKAMLRDTEASLLALEERVRAEVRAEIAEKLLVQAEAKIKKALTQEVKTRYRSDFSSQFKRAESRKETAL